MRWLNQPLLVTHGRVFHWVKRLKLEKRDPVASMKRRATSFFQSSS
jgi:hypothetical protein